MAQTLEGPLGGMFSRGRGSAPSSLGKLRAVAGEKKKRKAPGSPSSERKKPKKSLARKPKESSSSRAPDSDSLYQVRDEPEEDDFFVAHGPTSPEERATVAEEIHKADPPQARGVDEKTRAEISRNAKHTQKEAPIALVLHHESFLRYRAEVNQLEAEIKELAEKRDMYKLLSEQHEGVVKNLQAELDTAQKEHADLVKKRDALGSEREVVKAQMHTTSANAEEMMAQYRADVKASEAQLKTTVEYMKRLSRWENLEEIHAQGLDLSAKIQEAKRLEVEAKKLADPKDEEGSEGSDELEDKEGPDNSGNKAGSGEDRA
uniref:Myosin heavy chain, embryonic smooth muscle isoform-like n=1 Tax=Nicotiana tabacum TaxID=4097 RepID=A0A1S4CG44_TOBAC|nr:PREDICTED: myosin heavy chain, embryonic smooth muscle isoform-like [Nicotiana tabacum]